MSCEPYFLLDGAYNEISLHNSPDPISNMHYPCLPSYPFISVFTPEQEQAAHVPLETDYNTMNKSYQTKPCPYCPYYQGR